MALHGHSTVPPGFPPGHPLSGNLGETSALSRDFISQGGESSMADALRRRQMELTQRMSDSKTTLFEGQSPFSEGEQDSVFGGFDRFSLPPPSAQIGQFPQQGQEFGQFEQFPQQGQEFV